MVYMGTVLFPFLFFMVNLISWLFLNKTFCVGFKCIFVYFVVSVYHSCSEGKKEDYIKCEMIGGLSLRYLNTFLNSFLLLAVNYININQNTQCIVTIVDCTHAYHVVQNIRAYHTLLLLFDYTQIIGHLQLPSRTW